MIIVIIGRSVGKYKRIFSCLNIWFGLRKWIWSGVYINRLYIIYSVFLMRMWSNLSFLEIARRLNFFMLGTSSIVCGYYPDKEHIWRAGQWVFDISLIGGVRRSVRILVYDCSRLLYGYILAIEGIELCDVWYETLLF